MCVCVCVCVPCVCVCVWSLPVDHRHVGPALGHSCLITKSYVLSPPTDDATQNATKSHVFTEIEQIKVKSNHRDTCSGASPGHFVSQVSM